MTSPTPAWRIPAPRESDTLPNTEALGQEVGDFAVLPGSAVYERWAELLRGGEITYDEFIDWMSPPRTVPDPNAFRRLWNAFFDAAFPRRQG